MTAFARVERPDPRGGLIRVELRSCNHRFLSVICNLPPDLRLLETELRRRIAARLTRGRIDTSLSLAEEERKETLDERTLARLAHSVEQVARAFPTARLQIDPLAVLNRPGIRTTAPGDDALEKKLHSVVLESFEEALGSLLAERRREGALLGTFLRERLVRLRALLEQIEQRIPTALDSARTRLHHQLRELEQQEGLSEQPREQALLLLSQKSNVGEELDRLRTHFARIDELLEAAEPIGKHLDFLLQETQRELNTLGMKLAHLGDFSDPVVKAKVRTEQLREQSCNLE